MFGKKIGIMVFFLLFLTGVSWACVGKTIYVGHLSTQGDEVMANILARLITERTGTSVKIKKFSDMNSLLKASQAGDIDIFTLDEKNALETTGLKKKEEAKETYNVKFNLVWLKAIDETNGFLVPVIRKDTLKKFPALPKLLEKLTGLLNNNQLEELRVEVDKRGMKEVVKEFLKKKGLI